MNKNYTHLIVISDESSSMAGPNAIEYQDGINDLIQEQKDFDGKCTLTFCTFASIVKFPHEFSDIDVVSPYVNKNKWNDSSL